MLVSVIPGAYRSVFDDVGSSDGWVLVLLQRLALVHVRVEELLFLRVTLLHLLHLCCRNVVILLILQQSQD